MATRVVVHGRVQGVFFRASTRDLADRHDLVGWVRNDPGGTVTVHLEGPSEGVQAVLRWIRGGGPPDARVERIEEEPVDDEGVAGFEVRHDVA